MEHSDKQRAIMDRIAVTATCSVAILILGICTAIASPRGDAPDAHPCGPRTTANAHVSESDAPTASFSVQRSAACAKTATLQRS